MQIVTLNDGTELENSYAAETLDNLFLYISNGMSMLQVLMLMADPSKTEEITYTAGENTTVYSGYTVVQGITQEHGGMISVVLRRG